MQCIQSIDQLYIRFTCNCSASTLYAFSIYELNHYYNEEKEKKKKQQTNWNEVNSLCGIENWRQ